MSLEIGRIKELREENEAERLSWDECAEIEEAYREWCSTSTTLSEDPDNALIDGMLNELEGAISPLEWAIYDYVEANFGSNEADNPSWYIGPLAKALEDQFSFVKKGVEV